MQAYLLSLIGASLAAALVGILSPDGTGNGLSKHMKLLISLFLVCVLIAPLTGLFGSLRGLADETVPLPGQEGEPGRDYEAEMDSAMNSASRTYFCQSLTQLLESRFSIAAGNIRCTVEWNEREGLQTPEKVTVILSGGAIWKNPREIESFVSDLIGCPCVSAIE